MSERPDTYRFAKNAGDRKFLEWIAARLVEVHGENPNVDYIRTLRDFAAGINPLVERVQILEQLIFKYYDGSGAEDAMEQMILDEIAERYADAVDDLKMLLFNATAYTEAK